MFLSFISCRFQIPVGLWLKFDMEASSSFFCSPKISAMFGKSRMNSELELLLWMSVSFFFFSAGPVLAVGFALRTVLVIVGRLFAIGEFLRMILLSVLSVVPDGVVPLSIFPVASPSLEILSGG